MLVSNYNCVRICIFVLMTLFIIYKLSPVLVLLCYYDIPLFHTRVFVAFFLSFILGCTYFWIFVMSFVSYCMYSIISTIRIMICSWPHAKLPPEPQVNLNSIRRGVGGAKFGGLDNFWMLTQCLCSYFCSLLAAISQLRFLTLLLWHLLSFLFWENLLSVTLL